MDNGLSFIATNANPLPNGLLQPARSSAGLLTNIGQGVSFFADNRKHPYAQRWSLGIQQELPLKFMIEASYVGNRATRLNINRELSYTPAQYLSTSLVRDQATIDFLGKTFPNPYAGLNSIYGSTMTRANLLRPYNEFSSVHSSAIRPATPGTTPCRPASNAAWPMASRSRPPTPGRNPWRPPSS